MIDGRKAVLAGAADGHIHLFDAVDGSPVRPPFHAHNGYVSGIAVLDDDEQPKIASISVSEKAVQIWNLGSKGINAAREFAPAGGFTIERIPFEKDPSNLIFEGPYHQIKMLSLSTETLTTLPWMQVGSHIYCFRFGVLDGEHMIAGAGADDPITVWSLKRATMQCKPMRAGTMTAGLAFAQWHGQNVLLSGGFDGRVSVWNLKDGSPLIKPFTAHSAGINAIISGTMFNETVGISAGGDSTLAIWRLGGEILRTIYLGGWILSIKALDSDRIAAGTADGVVAIKIPGLALLST